MEISDGYVCNEDTQTMSATQLLMSIHSLGPQDDYVVSLSVEMNMVFLQIAHTYLKRASHICSCEASLSCPVSEANSLYSSYVERCSQTWKFPEVVLRNRLQYVKL